MILSVLVLSRIKPKEASMSTILVMRHGDASFEAETDSQRQLSDLGRDEIRQIVASSAEELMNVSSILVSPYLRAQQTAKLVCDELKKIYDKDISLLCRNSDVLVPNTNADLVISQLAKDKQLSTVFQWPLDKESKKEVEQKARKETNKSTKKVIDSSVSINSSVLIVSHQPLVSHFLASLCEPVQSLSSLSYQFSLGKYSMGTANLACIECDVLAKGCANLLWIKKPNEYS